MKTEFFKITPQTLLTQTKENKLLLAIEMNMGSDGIKLEGRIYFFSRYLWSTFPMLSVV